MGLGTGDGNSVARARWFVARDVLALLQSAWREMTRPLAPATGALPADC